MTPNTSTMRPGPDCARIVRALPLLALGMLTTEEAAEARAHLGGCAYCTAVAAAHSRLDAALREYAVAQEIGAPEPSEVARLAIAKSVVASPTAADSLRQIGAPHVAPAPVAAMRIARSSRPLVGAIAAMLLIGLSAALFTTLARVNGPPTLSGSATQTARAIPSTTATLLPATPLNLPSNTILWSVSMSSAEDGWAVGYQWDRSNPHNNKSLFIHYHQGQWAITQTFPGVTVQTVSMDSSVDGWAGGSDANGGVLLRYTGGRWQTLPLTGRGGILKIQMLSPTDGWALGDPTAPDACPGSCSGSGQATPGAPAHTGPWGLYHYVNGTWTDAQLPAAIDADGSWEPSYADFDMLSSTDGWMVFGAYVLRYQGGSWHVASTLGGSSQTWQRSYPQLDMLSDQSGWLSDTTASGALTVFSFNGGAWAPVALPNDPAVTQNSAGIAAISNSEVWLFEGVYGLQYPTVSPPLTLHYVNASWSRLSLPTGVKVVQLSLVSKTKGWAVAWTNANPWTSAIYHYDDGGWTQYPS